MSVGLKKENIESKLKDDEVVQTINLYSDSKSKEQPTKASVIVPDVAPIDPKITVSRKGYMVKN